MDVKDDGVVEKLLVILGCAVLGGVLFGAIGIQACRWTTSTPKFCGLMALYTAPAGIIIGTIVGSILSKKPRQ
jgi:hypothetical protein